MAEWFVVDDWGQLMQSIAIIILALVVSQTKMRVRRLESELYELREEMINRYG